jgi:hypothetical protein
MCFDSIVRGVPIERDRVIRTSGLAIFNGDGQCVMVIEPGLLDNMGVPPTLLDFQTGILPGSRQPVVKLKVRVLHRCAFLDLNVQTVVPQVQHDDSIHFALPNELRLILREENAGEQHNRQ